MLTLLQYGYTKKALTTVLYFIWFRLLTRLPGHVTLYQA